MDASDQVVEVASNDGYLLQYFAEAGIPSLGIEPAANVAAVAEEKGIPTRSRLLRNRDGPTAGRGWNPRRSAHRQQRVGPCARPERLRRGNGSRSWRPSGRITMEFPHLLQLIEGNQFDTIYHEHFSYFSLLTATAVFQSHGLRIFDVDEIPTHGGSLRIYACQTTSSRLRDLAQCRAGVDTERAASLDTLDGYLTYPARVERVKHELLQFLIHSRQRGLRSCRLRRARERQHSAQLLWHSGGSDRLHGRSEPAQARSFPARNTLTDIRSGSYPRDATGLSGDPALEPVRRDHRRNVIHSGMGRAVRHSRSESQHGCVSGVDEWNGVRRAGRAS